MLKIRKNLTRLVLAIISLGLLSMISTASAQEAMTVEERLLRLEKAVTNLEEYALLLHYNQIGSVAEFENRIGELERSFSFIVGEVVQLQPAASTTGTTTGTTTAQASTAQPTATQPSQAIQATPSPTPSPTPTPSPSPTQSSNSAVSNSSVAPAAPATGGSTDLVYLQVGAYNDVAAAAAARADIEKLGYSVYEGPSGQTIRLFLGPFRQSDVEAMKQWLAQQGIDSFVVR